VAHIVTIPSYAVGLRMLRCRCQLAARAVTSICVVPPGLVASDRPKWT